MFSFVNRHIGPRENEIQDMLNFLGIKNLDELIQKAAPQEIRSHTELNLEPGQTENECLQELKKRADQNQIFKSYIGQGYYDTNMPAVIQRNILENPAWLTPYTPYQPEISQGRLQALLNFQTMITELTDMEIANASLLDEGTACAEAISMAYNNRKVDSARHIFMDRYIFPQTRDVIQTRADAAGFKINIGDAKKFDFNKEYFCIVIQTPASDGRVWNWETLCQQAKNNGITTIFSADLLSLCLFKTPGKMNADIVTGTCQRLGLPMMFGGPHAAYLAARKEYTRLLPGRVVGVSKDRHGRQALRLAIQTREQHIRREKATSNICTAQALPAVLASMFAVYHGPQGLYKIAKHIHQSALCLLTTLRQMGFIVRHDNIFDTVQVEITESLRQSIYEVFIQHKINVGRFADGLSISINETTSKEDIKELLQIFAKFSKTPEQTFKQILALNEQDLQDSDNNINTAAKEVTSSKNEELVSPIKNLVQKLKHAFCRRTDLQSLRVQSRTRFEQDFLLEKQSHNVHGSDNNVNTAAAKSLPLGGLRHPVFSTYHSETCLLRYIHYLQSQDLSLAHSMIPLGSCTMKLNATAELLPITWPAFAKIHPFAPLDQARGYHLVIQELGKYLCEITGFESISFQPNAGSQGEYAGLLAIRRYHEQLTGGSERNICLIPVSAHGTNPASARMAGLKVVDLLCDPQGNISHEDLKKKITEHKDHLAALMITYPSTFGVFEKGVPQVCDLVHAAGGLVYLDGANMNALIGISRPAHWGVDICHLNLHKTFCIPHGGGGPGVGPILTTRLKEYLPNHWYFSNNSTQNFTPTPGKHDLQGSDMRAAESRRSHSPLGGVAAAPWGSAGILMVSWAYIRLMGSKGLRKATDLAILNANYMAGRLSEHFKILYRGENNLVAHECILDVRKFRHSADVSVDDIAKRLIDYGFHAPTISWPVPGALMIEPTESEDKGELDRFCEALIMIKEEIKEVKNNKYSKKNNVLKNAPHVLEDAMMDKWPFPYSRQKAFYPLSWVREHKFWPAVSRVEQAYGDINLFCACPPVTSLTPIENEQ